MRKLLIILLISTTSIAIAQEDMQLGLFAGPDFSLLKAPSDTIEVSPIVTPFVGLEFFYPVKDLNHIRFGGSLSMKRSLDNRTDIKYSNTFISLFANYHYHISKGIYFTVGPQYSILINARSLNGAVKTDISGYDSYMSVNAGIDFKLQPHLNLGISYEYPFNNPQLATWPSLKAKLTLLIDKDLFSVDERRNKVVYTKTKINELKETALLVSLRSFKKQIDAFVQTGDTTRANLVRQKRDLLNREVIEAFNSEFTFCPVYFFYNYDTKKVKSKDFKNVFINNDLKIDPTIQFDLDTFLIGKLGYTLTDTTETFGYSDVYKNGYNLASGYARTATIESDISHYGFNIKDQDLNILDHPFPGFTSGYFAFLRRPPSKIIKKVNENLYKYFANSRP